MWVLDLIEEIKDEETWYGKVAIIGILILTLSFIVGICGGIIILFVGALISGFWPVGILIALGIFFGICFVRWVGDGL